MPYVKQTNRDKVDASIFILRDIIIHQIELEDLPGLLNYIITRLVAHEVQHNKCYRTINEAIGVLECVKLELYRRLAAIYEDQKCKENGDVYEY